jgi:hypothetical protein
MTLVGRIEWGLSHVQVNKLPRLLLLILFARYLLCLGTLVSILWIAQASFRGGGKSYRRFSDSLNGPTGHRQLPIAGSVLLERQ